MAKSLTPAQQRVLDAAAKYGAVVPGSALNSAARSLVRLGLLRPPAHRGAAYHYVTPEK